MSAVAAGSREKHLELIAELNASWSGSTAAVGRSRSSATAAAAS
jgi:hypothetical protein